MVGEEGSGKQHATPVAEGEAPLPLCTRAKPPPLPARLRLPPLPVHGAWELRTCELRMWRGELGEREGVEAKGDVAPCMLPHPPCSRLRKKTVPSLCKLNYSINIYIPL